MRWRPTVTAVLWPPKDTKILSLTNLWDFFYYAWEFSFQLTCKL
jgi:hypothetical protein